VSGGAIVETDAAEARFAQRHERNLLDPAAAVSGLGVAHDLTRVADRQSSGGARAMAAPITRSVSTPIGPSG
jgi:hypothetical protein